MYFHSDQSTFDWGFRLTYMAMLVSSDSSDDEANEVMRSSWWISDRVLTASGAKIQAPGSRSERAPPCAEVRVGCLSVMKDFGLCAENLSCSVLLGLVGLRRASRAMPGVSRCRGYPAACHALLHLSCISVQDSFDR